VGKLQNYIITLYAKSGTLGIFSRAGYLVDRWDVHVHSRSPVEAFQRFEREEVESFDLFGSLGSVGLGGGESQGISGGRKYPFH
jgi:hypothetical protein